MIIIAIRKSPRVSLINIHQRISVGKNKCLLTNEAYVQSVNILTLPVNYRLHQMIFEKG